MTNNNTYTRLGKVEKKLEKNWGKVGKKLEKVENGGNCKATRKEMAMTSPTVQHDKQQHLYSH